MRLFAPFLELRTEHRWMLFAAFAFNFGFYMLIPFLAGFLKDNLMLSATLVGVVLGVRSFCQQGLFIVGGLLADVFGYKPLIILGCVLRAIGFWMFLFSSSTVLLFAAAILTGFAGALFTPAAQAYFAAQEDVSRAQMFSLVAVARNGGELLGPVCGVILLSISFDALCLAAGAPFAIFAVVFAFLISDISEQATPDARNSQEDSGEKTSIRDMVMGVLTNTPFIKFSMLMTGYFMLINQISFAIPLYLVAKNGAQQDVAWVLTLCAIVSVCFQIMITKFCEARNTPLYWIRVGLILMGLSFLALVPNWPGQSPLYHYMSLTVLAVVFTFGTMISFPFILSQISDFAGDKSVATHFGFFYLFGGVGLIAGTSLVGLAFDLSQQNENYAWYLLVTIGLLTAFLTGVTDLIGDKSHTNRSKI